MTTIWADYDLPPTTEPPLRRIGVAVTAADGDEFLVHAVDSQETGWAWSGVVHAPTADAALLEAFLSIRAEIDAGERIRFLVALPHGSPLWVHQNEVRAVLPGCTVQGPGPCDAELIAAATAALPAEPPAPSVESLTLPPLTVAADGSVRGRCCGYGWLASDGQYRLRGKIDSRRIVGRRITTVTELRAIDDAVRSLTRRHLTIYCDNSFAVAMARKWMAGEDILPEGYTTERDGGTPAGLVVAQRRLHRNRERLDIRWTRSHQGEPLNEGADALARLASRFVKGNSELTADSYRERAAGIAEAFAAHFREAQAGTV